MHVIMHVNMADLLRLSDLILFRIYQAKIGTIAVYTKLITNAPFDKMNYSGLMHRIEQNESQWLFF